MTKDKTKIVLFETEDKNVSLSVEIKDETVWLNRNRMAELFDRDVKTIGKHVKNARKRNYVTKKQLSQILRQLLLMGKDIRWNIIILMSSSPLVIV